VSFGTIYYSAPVTGFASFATIVCLFVIVYEKILLKKQHIAVHAFFSEVYRFLNELNVNKTISITSVTIDKWLQRKIGIPKKYQLRDPYFGKSVFIYTAILLALIPPAILAIQGSAYYLWGPSTFLGLYFFPKISSKQNDPLVWQEKPIRKFIILSVYNYMFYAIPGVFGWIIFKDTKILIGVESMRSNSLLYCLFALLIVYEFANCRILIRDIAFARNKLKKIIKYFAFSLLFFLTICILAFLYISFVEEIYKVIEKINTFNISWHVYLIVGLFVFSLPIILGILFIISIMMGKLIVLPIIIVFKVTLRFIVKRKLYGILFAVFFTILSTNILYQFFGTKTSK
jgi:hypothetical protein